MNFIFLKSIIIIIFFYCFSNKKVLKIPFTITDQINNKKHSLIQRLFINPKPISTFLVGSEKQKINFTIKLSNFYTCITSNDSNSVLKTYNETLSKTYKLTNPNNLCNLETMSETYESQETFIINKRILNDFPFLLNKLVRFNGMYDYAILGFSLQNKYVSDENFNFIKNMKKFNVINGYSFYFNFFNDSVFDDNNSGEIIIGDDEKFKNNDNFINVDLSNKIGYSFWNINFKNVFYGDINIYKNNNYNNNYNKEKFDNIFAEISIEFGLIIANYQMREFLTKNFFNENKCEYFYFNYDNLDDENSNLNMNLGYFVCNNSVDISKFQPIIFQLKDFNYNFTLNYNDLFFNYNNSYYFLILFGTKNLHFGRFFLKKFKIAFNQEKKIIYFNIKNNHSLIFNFDLNKNIIIIILFLIIICCIFFILKLIKIIPRKIRANELSENYEYLNKNSENYIEFSVNKNRN